MQPSSSIANPTWPSPIIPCKSIATEAATARSPLSSTYRPTNRRFLSTVSSTSIRNLYLKHAILPPIGDFADCLYIIDIPLDQYIIPLDQYIIPLDQYIIHNTRCSRKHNSQFLQIRHSSNTFGKSFFPTTAKEWNALPSDIISSSSIESFKTKLSKYLLDH